MSSKPRARQILELLGAGPKTSAEISEAAGLTRTETKHGIGALKRQRMAATSAGIPGQYEITQKGIYHLYPETDPERRARAEASYQKKLARNRKRLAAVRDAARAASGIVRAVKAPKPPVIHRIIPAPRLDEGIVSTAIQSRPAFQAAWC